LQSLLIVLAAVAVPTVASVVTAPPAHATPPAAGDVVYERNYDYNNTLGDYNHHTIALRHDDGTTVTVSTIYDLGVKTLGSPPVISPDGSKVAFVSDLNNTIGYDPADLYVINSDGSGLIQLDFNNQTPSAPHFHDSWVSWSPDSDELVFERHYNTSGYMDQLFTVMADGSETPTQLSQTSTKNYAVPAWSPDGTKIAYASSNGLETMAVSGSSSTETVVPDQPNPGGDPTWAPGTTSSRLYYVDGPRVRGIDLDGTNSVVVTYNGNYPNHPSVSADGTQVVYGAGNHLYSSLAASPHTTTTLTSGSGVVNQFPSYALGTWPPTPPSNTDVAISAPSPSDALYTKQITMNLSVTGVQKFQYGWSTTSTTAPNTSYLQESTDLTNKKGTLNYLGTYSGSGTTWNGGTTPDSNWYLWVRTVQTGGTPNGWATPLLVHTPKVPRWIGSGDSYSSGHHQDTDARYCPDPTTGFPSGDINCPSGGIQVTPNDAGASWVTIAAGKVNTALHVPSNWEMTAEVLAKSGATTAQVVSGQMGRMSQLLYERYDSWNVASIGGGADNTPWIEDMTEWYQGHFLASYPPWDVPNTTECPDTEHVYQALVANGGALQDTITSDLASVRSAARDASPGARILLVGYPYIIDTGQPC
jgi:hypothetical protein